MLSRVKISYPRRMIVLVGLYLFIGRTQIGLVYLYKVYVIYYLTEIKIVCCNESRVLG